MAGRHTKGFVKAVDGVSLAAESNSTLGIVGESGCGKTTLAKCIAGLVPASDGSMAFAEADVARSVEERPPRGLAPVIMPKTRVLIAVTIYPRPFRSYDAVNGFMVTPVSTAMHKILKKRATGKRWFPFG